MNRCLARLCDDRALRGKQLIDGLVANRPLQIQDILRVVGDRLRVNLIGLFALVGWCAGAVGL
ncbi:MAG: hypothetical protein ABI690_06795 [Chloroflexota bacterium]